MKRILFHPRALMLGLIGLAFAACQNHPGPTALSEDTRYEATTINGVALLHRSSSGGLAPAGFAAEVIGPNGGTISTDGARLTVPAHALAYPVLITMRGPVDKVWAYGFGPSGLRFASAAELEIRVKISGIDPSRLKVAGASDVGTDWQIIEGSRYDADRKAVVAPISHFSQYALCIE